MGNTQTQGDPGVCPDNAVCPFVEPCGVNAGGRLVENVTVASNSGKFLESVAAGAVRQQNWLRAGERRWLPEGIFRGQLLCGVDFSQSWVFVDTTCVLYGADGVVLASVGSHGLSRADGVSLDFVNNVEVFNICLERLNSSVQGLVIISTPAATDHLVRPGHSSPSVLPTNTSGPCTAYLASGVAVGADILPRQLCRMNVAVPSRAKDSAVVLLALHSGLERGEPWQLEAVGKNLKIPEGSSGVGTALASAVERTIVALANKAGKLASRERPQASLADENDVIVIRPQSGGALTRKENPWGGPSDVVEELAYTNRLNGEKHREAHMDQMKAADLQKALTATQDTLRRVCGAVQAVQYDLEAWRREALLKVQEGDAAKVAALLAKFPHTFPFEVVGAIAHSVSEMSAEEDEDYSDAEMLIPLAPPPPGNAEDDWQRARGSSAQHHNHTASTGMKRDLRQGAISSGNGIRQLNRQPSQRSQEELDWSGLPLPHDDSYTGVMIVPPPPGAESPEEAMEREYALRQREIAHPSRKHQRAVDATTRAARNMQPGGEDEWVARMVHRELHLESA